MQSAEVLRILSNYPRVKWFVMVSFEAIARVLFSLPRYRTINCLKASFLRMNGAKVGARVVFYPGVWITPGRGLVLGDDVDLAVNVLIDSSGGVEIGDRTLIGYRSCILSANHIVPHGRGRIFESGRVKKLVVIEKDVWIGAGVTVLPGVRIGEGAVVGAGSIVTKDIPPMVVAVGNPAKVIRERT